jgi:hypothetical protein
VKGKREPEGAPIANYFPRILSDETFEAAQRGRLDRRTAPVADRKGSGGAKGKHFANLFSKLAICAYCKQPMLYENKGTPPKGQSYLTCSSVIRKLDCPMKGRWRYDQFETAFLAFVEQLDLASLVSSEKHKGKRSELAGQLEAVEGKQKMLNHELRRTYETSMKLDDFGSDFLAEKIREYEGKIAETKQRQQELQHEIAKLDETALTYYSSPDQMAALIEQVRSTRGEAVYKLRAQIASRLQGLIKDLQLMLPLDDDDEQQFEVNFRDGAHLMVFVDPANPSRIKRQVRGDEEALTSTDEVGNITVIPANSPAEDEGGQDEGRV